jgi:hypothetical protein
MLRRTFLVLGLGGLTYACVPGGERKRTPAPAQAAAPDAGAHQDATAPKPAQDAGEPDAGEEDAARAEDAETAPPDAEEMQNADADEPQDPPDAGECQTFVHMHDTYAQALYFDGTYGPLTGVCTVDYVLANIEVDIEFWHGHGGQNHHYLITPEHFAALKRGERVMIETTEVDSHTHMLFIDPTDESYRVDGAPDVAVPNC